MRQNTYLIALGVLFSGFFTSLAVTPARSVSNKNYHLHFGTMHCLGIEDVTGYDDIVVERTVDGHEESVLNWNDVSVGEYHHFKVDGEFDSSYKIDVEEWDTFVNDDIGTVTINGDNIGDEYIRMDPSGRGDYSLTWTNLTPHRDVIKSKHTQMTSNQPSQEEMDGYENSINDDVARQGHQAVYNHLNQDDRMQKSHKAAVKVVHTFKKTSATASDRKAAVIELKKAIDFNPLRGIIEQIDDGIWPTIIIYGVVAPVNFGFFSFDMTYGIALDVNSPSGAVFLSFGVDIGLTAGDDGKVGIGLNRNELPGVAGFTYSVTKKSYEQLTGGITLSFDSVLDAPNLQEVTYTYGLLPAGSSVSYEYTAVLDNFEHE